LDASTIHRKLLAVSSLFDALCGTNAVQDNPFDSVNRARADSKERKTSAIGDCKARALLVPPDAWSLQSLRDRAILCPLLYHGLRRASLDHAKDGPNLRTVLIWTFVL
jgi:site-specific recombinase XerD